MIYHFKLTALEWDALLTILDDYSEGGPVYGFGFSSQRVRTLRTKLIKQIAFKKFKKKPTPSR